MKKFFVLFLFFFSTIFISLSAFANYQVKIQDVDYRPSGMSRPVNATVSLWKNDVNIFENKTFKVGDQYSFIDIIPSDKIVLKDTATTDDLAKDQKTICVKLQDITQNCTLSFYAAEELCYEGANCPDAGIDASRTTCSYTGC